MSFNFVGDGRAKRLRQRGCLGLLCPYVPALTARGYNSGPNIHDLPLHHSAHQVQLCVNDGDLNLPSGHLMSYSISATHSHACTRQKMK